MTKPTVLFLCTHNAGRSQMAMGFVGHLAGDRAHAYSGGSEPAEQVNPSATAAMAEKGIDIGAQNRSGGPTRWSRRPTSWSTSAAATPARCYRDDATKSGSCPTLRAGPW